MLKVNSDFGRDKIDKAVKSVEAYKAANDKLKATLKGQQEAQKVVKGSVTALKDEIKRLNKQYQDQTNQQNKNSKASQELASKISSLRQKQFDLNRETSRLNKTFKASVGSYDCLLYTSPSPRDGLLSRMPSSA